VWSSLLSSHERTKASRARNASAGNMVNFGQQVIENAKGLQEVADLLVKMTEEEMEKVPDYLCLVTDNGELIDAAKMLKEVTNKLKYMSEALEKPQAGDGNSPSKKQKTETPAQTTRPYAPETVVLFQRQDAPIKEAKIVMDCGGDYIEIGIEGSKYRTMMKVPAKQVRLPD
jgi:hypothetical protein